MSYGLPITRSLQIVSLSLETSSASETAELGSLLASLLGPGDVLPLWGEFGVGKTTLVQGVGRGLGVGQAVVSPSFGLIHSYAGERLTLYHLDLYRIQTVDEAEAFGVEEVLDGGGAVFIEWPEVIAGLLPEDRLDVTMEHLGEEGRLIRFEASGERSLSLLRAYSDLIGSR